MIIFLVGLCVLIAFVVFLCGKSFGTKRAKNPEPIKPENKNLAEKPAYDPTAIGHRLIVKFLNGELSWSEAAYDIINHHLIRDDDEIALVNGLKNGKAGITDFLDKYFEDRNGYFQKDGEVALVQCFGEGCAAAKELLIKYIKCQGLKKEARAELNKYLEQRIDDDAKAVFEVYLALYAHETEIQQLLVKWFEKTSTWAYERICRLAKCEMLASAAQVELVKLLEKGVNGAKEILLTCCKNFNWCFCEEAQVELVRCFERGVPGAKEILEKCICSYWMLHEKAEVAVAECFEKGVKGAYDLLKSIHAQGNGYKMPRGFYSKTEAVLCCCFEKGVPNSKTLLKLQIERPGLAKESQVALAKSYQKGIKGAYDLLLECKKSYRGLCTEAKQELDMSNKDNNKKIKNLVFV